MSLDSFCMTPDGSTTPVYTPTTSSDTSERTGSFDSLKLLLSNEASVTPSPTKIDAAEQEQESAVGANSSPHPPHPPTLQELSRIFDFRNKDRLPENSGAADCGMFFVYSSNSFNGVKSGSETWNALLVVFAPDVPRLMREGFYWTSENIAPEFSGFAIDCKWSGCEFWDSSGKLMYNSSRLYENRRYLLTDLYEECRWTACLVVSSSCGDMRVLSRFRPTDLTSEKLEVCAAKKNDCLTYFYSPFTPQKSINAIYDDMPLEGQWPWPKRNKGQGNARKNEERQSPGKGDEANVFYRLGMRILKLFWTY